MAEFWEAHSDLVGTYSHQWEGLGGWGLPANWVNSLMRGFGLSAQAGICPTRVTCHQFFSTHRVDLAFGARRSISDLPPEPPNTLWLLQPWDTPSIVLAHVRRVLAQGILKLIILCPTTSVHAACLDNASGAMLYGNCLQTYERQTSHSGAPPTPMTTIARLYP